MRKVAVPEPSPIQIELRRPLMRAIAEFEKQSDIEITVREEFQMGPYRADFWIRVERPSTMSMSNCYDISKYKPIAATLVVEADGNAYHSSPEQLKHDHERDRWIFENFAASTIRFTGREINGGPRRVSNMIIQFLDFLLAECNDSRLYAPEALAKRKAQRENNPITKKLDELLQETCTLDCRKAFFGMLKLHAFIEQLRIGINEHAN